MTGAMYSAISGMKSHMNKLNVIGNNIANVNTYGYKSARTTFKESIYSSVRSGSNGSNTVGGLNPAQLGFGCNVGTIDLDMSTKSYVPTGINLDCMINGDGFFLTGPKAGAGADSTLNVTDPQDLNLTRLGNLTFDSQGYLVDGYGGVIYGFVTCAGTVDPTTLDEAQLDVAGTTDKERPLVSTQLVPIRLPMAAKGDDSASPPIIAGSAVYPGVDAEGRNVYDATDGTGLSTGKTVAVNLDSISIDGETGKITGVNNADSNAIVIGYVPLAKVSNPNGVTHIQGPYYRAGEGAGTCTAASIGSVLDGKFMNNKPDAATGEPIYGTGGTNIIPNGLESSGTDIATEFSEMISTQRGYQANTRIITVTDSMLEELVNMKR